MKMHYDSPDHMTGDADGISFEGFCIPLPPSNLIFINVAGGFIGCGFFDMGTFEKLGIPAVKITGVSNLEELLHERIVYVTKAAEKLGIKIGMTGEDALLLMCQ